MDVGELVSPDGCVAVLQARAEELLSAVEILRKRLKKAPAGRLRVAVRSRRHGEVFCYYHVKDAANLCGEYIPQSAVAEAQALAQKDYDEAALTELERELAVIDNCLAMYRPAQLQTLCEELHRGRSHLVQPLQLSDEAFAARWQSVSYKGLHFDDSAPELRTSRGERVRSKSEIIIAETLLRLGIPYRYEYPLQLQVKDGSKSQHAKGKSSQGLRKVTFHPDFTCLNIRTRREFIWEHFGLMDDADYAQNAMGKLDIYEMNEIFYGDRLIFTRELRESPLTALDVERLAKKFLL